MADREKLASVENSLVQRYNERGYLLEDEVIGCCVDRDLDLAEIDAVCERLLKRNIIIKESVSDSLDVDDEDVYDGSHLDYDEFLETVGKEFPSCSHIVNQIKRILPPQKREWRNLIGEAKNGNSYAYERLILMYLRTIMKRAYDFSKTYYCDFEDCFQNGVLGFIKAMEKYDVTRPDGFAAYFSLWAVQVIDRFCTINGTVMTYPVHFKDVLLSTLREVIGESYSPEEVARTELIYAKHYSVEDQCTGIYDYLDFVFDDCFRDDYLRVSEGRFNYNYMLPYRQLYEDIECDSSMEDSVINRIFYEDIRKIVNSNLKDRELEVIIMRYGLDDNRPRTLEEVGKKLGVTRERIRQIEAKALRRLRLPFKKAGLIDYEETCPLTKELTEKQKKEILQKYSKPKEKKHDELVVSKVEKQNQMQSDIEVVSQQGIDKLPSYNYSDGNNKAKEESSEIVETSFISVIKNSGVEYIDMREKKGALWILGGQEMQGFVEYCKRLGYEFVYAPTGSKATNRRPGWWLKRGGK